MCIHEQCVPNLAVPPWRPGYEANECVYMCTSSINTILLVYNHVNFMCTLTTSRCW